MDLHSMIPSESSNKVSSLSTCHVPDHVLSTKDADMSKTEMELQCRGDYTVIENNMMTYTNERHRRLWERKNGEANSLSKVREACGNNYI